MTKTATAEAPATDIIERVMENPVLVFTSDVKFEDFYARVKAETDKLVADVSTKKGRDDIRSMTSKVTKTKTALVAAGKGLTESWRKQTTEVNAARNRYEAELETLAKEVRAPLTEWEAAEESREANCRATILWFQTMGTILVDDTEEACASRGNEVFERAIDPHAFEGFLAEAVLAKETAVASLFAAMKRLHQEEADKAELDKLRLIQAEREAADLAAAEAKAKSEREAAEELAARQAHHAAQEAAEKAEAERKAREERIALEAAEKAREEAQRKAAADAQALIDEANARAADAENKRAAAIAAEKAERDAADARAADQKHRTSVKAAAKQALMELGASEDLARKIVIGILSGGVPNVQMVF